MDLAKLGDIAIDEVAHVRLEEPRPTRFDAVDSIREPTPNRPLQVVRTVERRPRGELRLQLEGGVDESIRRAVYLALGERPHLDRLGPTDERVGQSAQPEQTSGAGEEKLAGPIVLVDACLDREDQIRGALDLVDHQQALVGDERFRVQSSSGEVVGPIEATLRCIRSVSHQVVDDRAD